MTKHSRSDVRPNSTNEDASPDGPPTVAGPDVGQRIRRLRQREGKTLRQLAGELGISPSALSLLENNHSGVSLQRLQLIANHFGVAIVDLLAEHSTGTGSVSQPQIIRGCAWAVPSVQRGSGCTYQVMPVRPDADLHPVLMSFTPGGDYSHDPICHAGQEVAFVLLGKIELSLDGEVIELVQGDMTLFSSQQAHAFRNSSESGPAVVLGVASRSW